MSIFVGAIADDDTGATDLAGMLTEQGMRVSLVLDEQSPQKLASWAADCDAVVIGTASRSIAKADAYARTFSAAMALIGLNPRVLAVKYCSTFDSTAEGNIGTSIDAAMCATAERFTVALPALPALGRTTYNGHHFVGQQLLSESSMRHHPLNPMTESYLPAHLQSQTTRRVGLVKYGDASEGALGFRRRLEELRNIGVEIAMLDCIDDSHLQLVGEGIYDLPLLTGSSAWAMVLPKIWREKGLWTPSMSGHVPRRTDCGSGILIVSGSCSEATRKQNAWAVQQGIEVRYLDLDGISSGKSLPEEDLSGLAEALCAGRTCMLSSTGRRENGQLPASTKDLSPIDLGVRVAEALGQAVQRLFAQCTPQGLIVAGGETSSALMRALELGGLRVGSNIEPGVPVCVCLAQPGLGVVLKSGNFGSVDFYGRAIDALRKLSVVSPQESEYKR